ncbi:MAG: IclR family transcriptional regulator C-terminal domain-containing protein [Victivallaceae bacterium]|jgi:DNA-binding IclR family transcriptional regulator
MNKLPAQKINGLIDGIAVLQELAMSQEPASGKIIAETLGLPQVRVNRILKTLAYLGLTYRNTSRKYSVGPGMHVLAAQSMAASGLLRRALPHLKQLGQSGRTVALGVLWKDQVCYLFHNSNNNEFADGLGRMLLYPAVESSIGMALLADLPVESIELQTGSKPDKELIKKLKQIRKQGYASVRNQLHISLAVPIGEPAYAAIAVSGIKTPEEEQRFIELLRKCAEDIS